MKERDRIYTSVYLYCLQSRFTYVFHNPELRAISPFPTVFTKDLHCGHVKTRTFMGKGLTNGASENTEGKEENTDNQHFPLFSLCFLNPPPPFKYKLRHCCHV